MRILLHKILLHPVLSKLVPLLDFLLHCVVKVLVRFIVGLWIAIWLLIIAVLEFIDSVKGIDSLWIRDSILATSLRVQ